MLNFDVEFDGHGYGDVTYKHNISLLIFLKYTFFKKKKNTSIMKTRNLLLKAFKWEMLISKFCKFLAHFDFAWRLEK